MRRAGRGASGRRPPFRPAHATPPVKRALFAVLAALAFHPAHAQEAPADTLGDVLVEAAPFALAPSRAPLALTVRTRTAEEVATDPAVGLDAVLAGLPGVWVSDRESYAQGERLLVRGLGWRAAFGCAART